MGKSDLASELLSALKRAVCLLQEYEMSATGELFNDTLINRAIRRAEESVIRDSRITEPLGKAE